MWVWSHHSVMSSATTLCYVEASQVNASQQDLVLPSSRMMTNSLMQKEYFTPQNADYKNWERAVSCSSCIQTLLFMHMWPSLCQRVKSQVPGADPPKESCWCTSMPTADDVIPPVIWLWPHIYCWIWDGTCWCLVILSPKPTHEIELSITINHVKLSTKSKTAMQNATAADPELSALAKMIIDGWPEHF